jgi:enamine deaminase RidA (YjgF/YER057c/UK114 family)
MTQRFGSGGPYEQRFSYSRAVKAGGHLWVAGCTSIVDGEVVGEGDPALQARTAIGNALAAVELAGFVRSDVVRTRMFIVDLPVNGESIAEVHGEMFRDVLPASTAIGVSALVDPRLLFEVEVEAYREAG